MKTYVSNLVRNFLKLYGYELMKTSLYPIQNPEALLEVKLEYIIAHHMLNTEDFFFIQIGALDGVSFDPIYPFVKKYNWKGILIEPQKYYFNQLVANYSDLSNNLLFLNCAIAEREAPQYFYTINEKIENLPTWTKGISSFNLQNILSYQNQIPNIKDFIVTQTIECITMANLIKTYGVTKVDLLQIDTEGYDYEIIKMINFNKIKPKIISYESKFLSTKKQQEITHLLASNNYKVHSNGHDTIAYLSF